MPKSVPNIQFLNPEGLKLYYPTQSMGQGTPAAPSAMQGPGGNYMALAWRSGYGTGVVPGIASWDLEWDGAKIGKGMFPYQRNNIGQQVGFAGNDSVPFYNLNNITDQSPSADLATGSAYDFGGLLIPNVHGNHRYVSNNNSYRINGQIDVPINIGTPGRYVFMGHWFAKNSSANITLVDILLDGVVVGTWSFFISIPTDEQSYTPYLFTANLTSGNHTISIRPNAANVGTLQLSFPRWWAFWDPLGSHGLPLISGNVASYLGIVYNPSTGLDTDAIGKPYMFLGSTSWYSSPNPIGIFSWDLNYGTSAFGGISFAFSDANVHRNIGFCTHFSNLNAGFNLGFQNDGNANLQGDGNDRAFLLAMPSTYIG